MHVNELRRTLEHLASDMIDATYDFVGDDGKAGLDVHMIDLIVANDIRRVLTNFHVIEEYSTSDDHTLDT